MVANLDTVFFASAYSASTISGNWFPVVLQTPFYFDNTSNFIVLVAQGGYTTGFSVVQATVADRSLIGNSTSSTASLQSRLADFGFDLMPVAPDAGISGFINPDDTICAGLQAVAVVLGNYGPATLTSATINWSINGITQTPYSWTGTIDTASTTIVNIGNFNFASGNVYSVTAYTSNPNGMADSDSTNDTSSVSIMMVNPIPSVVVSNPANTICSSDSVLISTTLAEHPLEYDDFYG